MDANSNKAKADLIDQILGLTKHANPLRDLGDMFFTLAFLEEKDLKAILAEAKLGYGH